MIHLIDNRTDEVLGYIAEDRLLRGTHVYDADAKSETLDFLTLIEGEKIKGLSERNRAIFKDDDDNFREVIIENIEDSNAERMVYANGSYLEDLGNAKPIAPGGKEQYTTKQWLGFALEDTGWQPGIVEYEGFRSISWTGYNTPYELLNIIANRFDMSLRFRVEVEYNRVVGRYVDLVKINHLFNGKEIVRGKDLDVFKRTVNTEDMATALICLGPEPQEEDEERLIELVYDDEANEKYNKPGQYIWKVYEPQTDNQDMTRDRLRSLGRTELDKRKEPSVDYEITAINFGHLYGHEKVRQYDRVRVKDEEMNRYAEANTKRITRNLLDETDRVFVFGDIVEFSREDLRAEFNNIVGSLRQRLDEAVANADNIRKEITDKVLKEYERKIEKGDTPPSEPKEGDLWLDTSGNAGVLYRYENGIWVKSSVSEASEIGAITREQALYETLTMTYKTLAVRHTELQNEVGQVLSSEYLVDNSIKSDLSNRLDIVNNIFLNIQNELEAMSIDTATIGRLIGVQTLIVDYRDSVHYLSVAVREANQSIDARFKLLQSQYTDEKFNDVMNKIAEKIEGVEYVDGQLIGNMALIQQLADTKKDLQDQLEQAKVNFANQTAGVEGRNFLLDSEEIYKEARDSGEPGDNYNYATIHLSESLDEQVAVSGYLDLEEGSADVVSVLFRRTDNATLSHRYPGLDENGYFNVTETITPSVDRLFVYIGASGSTRGNGGYLRKVMLNRGTKALPYSRPPEETEQKITTINQELTNIDGQLKAKLEQTDIQPMKDMITTHDTAIKAQADSISLLQDKTEVHGEDITKWSSEVASTAEELERTKTRVTDTESGLARAESGVIENATEISNKVGIADYEIDQAGVVQRFTGVEGSVKNLGDELDLRVLKTEYENGTAGLVGKNFILDSEEHYRKARDTGNASDNFNFQTYYTSEGVNGLLTISGYLVLEEGNSDSITALAYRQRDDGTWHNTHRFDLPIDENGYFEHQYNTDYKMARFYIYMGSSGTTRGNGGYLKRVKLECGTRATPHSKAPEDIDAKLTQHDNAINVNKDDISLRAKTTEMNQSQKTLAEVISELTVDTENGLTYLFNENGTMTGYNIGPDGFKLDASHILLTANSSLKLSVDAAKKAGTDAQGTANTALSNAGSAQGTANTALSNANSANSKAETAQSIANSKVSPDKIIIEINLTEEQAKIVAERIELGNGDLVVRDNKVYIKDATITNGHLVSVSFEKLMGGEAILGGSGQNGSLRLLDGNDNPLFLLDGNQAASSELSIADLYVENIHNEDVVKTLNEDITFYVRGSSYGSDDNDGLGLYSASASIQRLVDQLPKFINGNVKFNMYGTYDMKETVDISGFTGAGSITFDFSSSSGTLPISFNLNSNSVVIKFDDPNNQVTLESVAASVFFISACTYVNGTRMRMNGDGTTRQAVNAINGSTIDFKDCKTDNVDFGFIVWQSSRASIVDCTGNASVYGMWAARGGIIQGAGKAPLGNTRNQHTTEGGQFFGEWTYPSVSKPAPAPVVTRKTRTFTSSTAGHYYNSSIGWNTNYMASFAMQGKWGSVSMKDGLWFFGSAMRTALQAKKIIKVRVSLGRSSYNAQGYTGRRKFTLRMHQHASKPSGAPTFTAGTYTGNLSMGERRWFDVTSAFKDYINTGGWYGFGVKTSSTSNYEYMAMMKEIKVEVTYED
ncbi:phage tail protein [Salinicoccus sp. ID82-1]|uniref:phage tail spike protein n=1 Tax=Salinicoccus sp. ID82-1 TaxID=2820269 RepID=UPI001F27E212|nr:phage tail spike protein [Salinicoccus sp. ID82-1]MCG1009217.1 phage tail protein [Salinicoccus sp. ID82-1]